jgi:hypothetical protein
MNIATIEEGSQGQRQGEEGGGRGESVKKFKSIEHYSE